MTTILRMIDVTASPHERAHLFPSHEKVPENAEISLHKWKQLASILSLYSCHHCRGNFWFQSSNGLLKWNLFNIDMLITFCFGVPSNLSKQKSPTAEILRIYFLGTIIWKKYLPKISAVGLFSCDKFEETPKQKDISMSKLNKFYCSLKTCPYWVSTNQNVITYPHLKTIKNTS